MIYSTLIGVDQLRDRMSRADCVIVDTRHQLADPQYGERAYVQGHLPGAVFLHCDRDLSSAPNGLNGRHPLPDPAVLAGKLASSGISNSTQVVVYDDSQGMIAARLWWLLRWLGHRFVAVLDGGMGAWLAAGGELTDLVPAPVQAKFEPRVVNDAVVDACYVESRLDSQQMRLVDARAPDRFRGENESLDPIGGHIPGAVNRFFRLNLSDNGCFKPAADLREEWLQVIQSAPPDRVVHQCGSGVSACHNLLAMEHAGLEGSRLYAGSWSEWCTDAKRPMAK